jgi:hypothetical protein
MVTLHPDLIGMYEKVGATQLVAGFCVSAASTAAFTGVEVGKRWLSLLPLAISLVT